ncbi:MAG: peptide ABC transporter permease, partial [Pseudohongiellaceae bacterium]
MSESAAPITAAVEAMPRGVSLWQDAWARLRKNRLAMIGMGILVVVIIACLLAPVLSPYGYEEQDLRLGPTAPSAAHWLGTDTFGRDLLTRILYGGQVSLAVGFIATFVALLVGVTYGAIAGYVGGRVDAAMMRFVDIVYALPFMIFIILLMV